MVRSIRLSVLAVALLALMTALAPNAVAAPKKTPEEIAAANKAKAQQIADKAMLSIDKALGKGTLGFDKVADAVIANLDKLFSKNVTDIRKYQAAVAKASTQINKDSVKTLASVAKTIASTQKQIQKLNQPEVLATFSVDAAERTAEFVFPSAEALQRIQDRMAEIIATLEVP